MLQVGQETIELVGGNFQLQLVLFTPNREVALNAPLSIEDEVPRACVASEVSDGVGDHTAQPAETVFAAHSHALQPAQVVTCRSRGQGG